MFAKMDTISITLMKEDNNGKELNYTPFIKRAAMEFGGYTLSNQQGGWWSDDENRLMVDQSEKLDLSFDEINMPKINVIRTVVSYLFEIGGQESVFVAFNGKPFLVFPNQVDELISHINDTFAKSKDDIETYGL